MANAEIKKALQDYGLDDQEVKVYLAVLKLGSATAKEVSVNAKIKRTSVYPVAERLVERGIMGEYKARYGTHYTVSSPKQLLVRLSDIEEKITTVLPELEALEQKDTHEPKISYYKGRQGYLTVINDSLQGYSHEILYMANSTELINFLGEKLVQENYIPTRVKRKIKFKQLVFEDESTRKEKESDVANLRQTKFLSPEHRFEAATLIYKDKVAYFTTRKELISVLIQSKEISEMERKKFFMIWDKLSH